MRGPAARGFTLVEVLIALVIVALVLAAAMRAGGTLIVTQEADNRLAELRLARAFPAVGTSESKCPQAELVLVCVVDVRTTPDPRIHRIDVRVVDDVDRARQLAHRLSFQANLP